MSEPRSEQWRPEWLDGYLDGELSEQQRQRVEQRLRHDGELRAELQRLQALRRELAELWDALPTPPPERAEAVWRRIEAALALEGERGPEAPGSPGAAEPDPPARARVLPLRRPGRRGRRRLLWGAAAALGLAAAAGWLLWVRLGASPARAPGTSAPVADAHGAQGAASTLVETLAGSRVVEVDFGSNVGTVFQVPGASGRPVAVVWIEDEGEP